MAGLTEYQKDILIRTALGEAGGEGEDGMADVLHVILNRAASGKFPSDPARVALQNKQFSSWNSGAGGNNPSKWSASSAAYQTAARVLEQVATGSKPDQTGGALYFHTPSVSPSWAKGVNTNGKIVRNGHVFYPTNDNPSVATALDTQRPSPTPATPSAAVTAARNRQNMTPAADLQAMDRHKGAAFLSKDGQKVIDTAGIVFGDQMTTRLPGSGPSASDKVRAAAVTPRAVTPVVSASDKTRAAAVAPRPAAPVAVSASDMARGNTPPVAAPKPAASASDKVRGTNGWETIATIPTTAVGGPPTTRKVQSIPITAPTAPTKPTQPSNIASARSEQAAARGPGTPKVTLPAASPLASALTPAGAPLQVPGAPVPAAPTAAIIAARQPKKVAPVPAVRQAIVPPVAPRQAASVAVATARSVVPAPAATTVAAFQAQGMTAAQAYDAANKAAKDRAEAGATKGHTSSGGMKYDPDSGGWKWTG